MWKCVPRGRVVLSSMFVYMIMLLCGAPSQDCACALCCTLPVHTLSWNCLCEDKGSVISLLPSAHVLFKYSDVVGITLGDEDCILPSKLQAALQQILEEREDILRQEDGDRCGGQQADLSSLVSEGFVRFFVELVGHYPFHMVKSANGTREVQRGDFRKSHPSRGVRQFLQLFMDTQMFAGFIQDKELRKGGGRGLFEVRAAEYLDSYPEPEPSAVKKFLKGLGNKMKLLQMKWKQTDTAWLLN